MPSGWEPYCNSLLLAALRRGHRHRARLHRRLSRSRRSKALPAAARLRAVPRHAADGGAGPRARPRLRLLLQRAAGTRSAVFYGTLAVLVVNTVAHFYTVAHITATDRAEADRRRVRVGLGLAEGAVLAHLPPRHRADLAAGDPRHRGLYVRQRADDGVGRDLPLRRRHQARLDRDRAHGRGRRDRVRRRHGDRDHG